MADIDPLLPVVRCEVMTALHFFAAVAHANARVEELIGGEAERNAKRAPAPEIQQQLERVSQLLRARQRMVSEVLDFLLAQAR